MVQHGGYCAFVASQLANPLLRFSVPVEDRSLEVAGQNITFVWRVVCSEVLAGIVEVFVFELLQRLIGSQVEDVQRGSFFAANENLVAISITFNVLEESVIELMG